MRTTSVTVMAFFFESVIPKVLDHSYVQSSFSTITIHLDNGITDMDQYRCGAGNKKFDLLLYASLSLKQA